ncbi:MAG: ABC transporter permease, partial [Jatrophihabitantaceae bacterium]
MTSQPVTHRPPDDELVVSHEIVAIPVSARRRTVAGIALVATGLICVLAWGLGSNPGDAAFALSDIADKHQIPFVRIPGKAAGIALGLFIVSLGLWHVARGFSARSMRWVLPAVLGSFVIAFLCWTGTGSPGEPMSIFGLLQGTIFLAVPLILGALSGILCERSGVINVAIEGQLLAGAFAGAFAATVAHNVGVGIITAMLAGALIGALLALFAIRYAVNQVVLGVVLNLLALGLTNFGYDALMQKNAEGYNNPTVLSPIKVPLLGDIPLVGPLLFNANIIVY